MSEFEVVAHILARARAELLRLHTDNGAFGTRLLHLYRHGDHEGHVGIALARLDRLEHSVELAAVGSEHLNIVAHVLLVLAAHLERRCKAGRAYLEAVIIGFAVENLFYAAGYAGTGVDIDTAR